MIGWPHGTAVPEQFVHRQTLFRVMIMVYIRTWVVPLLAAVLLASPTASLAGPYESFVQGAKVQNGKIRNTINTAIRQRAKDKYQKAASKRYTRNYNATYKKVTNYTRSDARSMHAAMAKHSSSNTVKSRIKKFDGRISQLKKFQKTIAKDIKKMKRDKTRWWYANDKYFDGRDLSATKLRQLAFWVQLYGTRSGIFLGAKYHTTVSLGPGMVPRRYTGGITPEIAYLKKLSGNIGVMIRVYEKARRDMARRLAQIERQKKSRKKGATKKLPPPPTPMENPM